MQDTHADSPSVFLLAVFGAIIALTLAPVVLLVDAGESIVSLFVLLAAGDALALWGVYRLARTGSAFVAWCAFGANLGFGMVTIFSIGEAPFLIAIALLAYIIAETKKRHVPAVTWEAVAGHTVTFLIAVGLILTIWT